MKKKRLFFHGVLLCMFFLGSPFPEAAADEQEYRGARLRFENFIRCELTRTGAEDYFNGKSFEINMINLFDVRQEGDINIFTGAFKCWVENGYRTRYAAIGVEELYGRKKVSYFVVRKKDFKILATELMNFPYKERCPWSRYWIDTD
ncbi:MAG: hypothetical protein R6V41_05145 [Desulfobacteraceae bacterium]